MPNSSQSPRVVYTPEFKRNVRQLAKKYRHIKSDVQPIIDDIKTIYSKTEQSDITPAEIPRIILDREIQGSIAGDRETESDDS